MDPNFIAEFNTEETTELHKKVLNHCKSLVDMSRRYMRTYHETWDHNDDVYQCRRTVDKDDADAANRKEPVKMVVPLTFAQVQTFIAFCVSLFTQREHVFELVGTGEEDHKAAKLAEALIQRDLTVNIFEAKLNQFLLDIARFGLGVFKTAWVHETELEVQEVEAPSPTNAIGQQLFAQPEPMMIEQEVTSYLGNRIVNVSPYCFFPDVRLPLSRFQEGEFCASEETYDMVTLYDWAAQGMITGMQWLKPFKADVGSESDRVRTHLTRALEQTDANAAVVGGEQKTLGTVILTEVQLTLIPKRFVLGEGDEVTYPLGESERPEKWLVWIANDQRVINFEKLNTGHSQYTYDIGEFTPDIHKLVSATLCDYIDMLQDVASWLINTHVTNVRKVVGDRMVVDPAGVNMEDVKERRPVIRLAKDAQRQGGIDKYVKQLDMMDVTSKHMDDSSQIHGLVQVTTGISDNALGQYFTGRRTATESRNANTGAAARLKLTALLLFKTALEPMARKMVANHKRGLDVETFVRVAGEMSELQTYQQFVAITRKDLKGSYDFEVFDGTLPSERNTQAQALEEFMIALMGNPQVVMLLGFDPVKIGEEWLTLRGIRNPKRFKLDQVRQQELMLQMQQAGLVGANEQQQPNGAAQPGLFGGAGAVSLIGQGNASGTGEA
jgi:hypothetical protein